ncbi:S-layer homology domain-containing protein [Paenibacillus sp. GCM10027626]|uniref:S-layer homology domain-containing protein n=1 Tax=Paenibacillus sp. GCM10027626 TaxID=3273411 RepID=UPI0036439648
MLKRKKMQTGWYGGLIILLWAAIWSLPGEAAAAGLSTVSTELHAWQQGDVKYVLTDEASSPIRVEWKGGEQRFSPFAGMGPIVTTDSGAYIPSDGTAVLAGWEADGAEDAIAAHYELAVAGEQVPYTVKYKVANGRLSWTITSSHPKVIGAVPGFAEGFGGWKQQNITRYAELYAGQNWYAQPVFHKGGKFFVFADWSVSEGNGTDYRYGDPGQVDVVDSQRQPSGNGPIDLAPPVRYAPNGNGVYAALNETLTFTAAQSLWDAIPSPAANPSPYMAQLADKVYLDIWAGDIRNARQIIEQLQLFAGEQTKLLTIYQPWGAKGWDATLPDNYNPAIGLLPSGGTIEEIGTFIDTARQLGFAGLRTNYVWMSDASPSYLAGQISRAKQANGDPAWFIRPNQWQLVAQRQETDMKRDFAPNASFSDQLASGGMSPAYIDYSSEDTSMRSAIEKERALIEQIKSINPGPFGSESSNAEFLLGNWYDFGEFGLSNGHNRKQLLPDYKLRKMHTNAMMYGAGIPSRFFENPPFPLWGADQSFPFHPSFAEVLDDYRATEIMYGNGAYIGYLPNMPYAYMLTELLVVGQLQKHYANVEVNNVYYRHGGNWLTLEQLYDCDDVTEDSYTQVNIVYSNGLAIYVNRAPEQLTVDTGTQSITIPQYGWLAYKADGSVLAYSALEPASGKRVDYYEDATMTYLDPRGATVKGVDKITLWENGTLSKQYDAGLVYDAAAAFSAVQGSGHWKYEQYNEAANTYSPLAYDAAAGKWGNAQAAISASAMEASAGYRAVRQWQAPYGGRVQVSIAAEAEQRGHAVFKVTVNGQEHSELAVPAGEGRTELLLRVQSGDLVRFELAGANGEEAGPVESAIVLQYAQDLPQMKLNAGAGYYITSGGALYYGEVPYSSGRLGLVDAAGTGSGTTSQPIDGTDDDALYQSQRYGNVLEYRADRMPAGHYEVTLHFAETYFDAPGGRLMDIYVQDGQVEQGLDIYAAAGGAFRAFDKSYIAEVTDGTLRIKLTSSAGGASLAGISVAQAYDAAGQIWIAQHGSWEQLDNGFGSASFGFRTMMAVKDKAWDHFSASFKLHYVDYNGDRGNWAGLVLGDYYVFLRANGGLSLYRYTTGEMVQAVDTNADPVAGEVPMRVEVRNGEIRIYAGNMATPVIAYTDNGLTSTSLAFIVWQSLVNFTDIHIQELDGSEEPAEPGNPGNPGNPDNPDNSGNPGQPGGSGFTESPDGTGSPETPDSSKEPHNGGEAIVFSDLDGCWAAEAIYRAARRGIVFGYPDGAFHPEQAVTRQQFIVMLARGIQLEGTKGALPFRDSELIARWAREAVGAAAASGLVKGYADGSFRPGSPITRQEMIVLLSRAFGLEQAGAANTPFADDDAIRGWARPAIAAAVNSGLVNGRGGNMLAPQATATRAEAAVLLLRFLEEWQEV